MVGGVYGALRYTREARLSIAMEGPAQKHNIPDQCATWSRLAAEKKRERDGLWTSQQPLDRNGAIVSNPTTEKHECVQI